MPKPSISMPNAVSNRPGFDDDNASANASPQHQTQAHQQQSGQKGAGSSKAANDNGKKAAPGKDAKAGANAQSSGWFSWFKLKPKNQMILPDDKNPTIVWDPDKKRWVNTEGEDAGEEAFKPPPKMADLMPTPVGPPQAPAAVPNIPTPQPVAGFPPGQMPSGANYGPAASLHADPNGQPSVAQMQPTGGQVPAVANPKVGEPTKVPTLQSNMFKMQRNRTLKKSYVDVFNPSGAAPSRPAEPILAPAVPAMATPQGGFFIPGAAPVGGQPNDSAAEGMPSFYNPNQFPGGYQQQ
ncbi:AAEL012885-PA [Aedes aegypti]|nr:AAEL012885-PA [Aedes aegypti]